MSERFLKTKQNNKSRITVCVLPPQWLILWVASILFRRSYRNFIFSLLLNDEKHRSRVRNERWEKSPSWYELVGMKIPRSHKYSSDTFPKGRWNAGRVAIWIAFNEEQMFTLGSTVEREPRRLAGLRQAGCTLENNKQFFNRKWVRPKRWKKSRRCYTTRNACISIVKYTSQYSIEILLRFMTLLKV